MGGVRDDCGRWGLGGVALAAEAVGAVCDAVVGDGPCVIVGYSMGGRVGLALAERRPRLLEGGGGLVLVSSSPGLTRYGGGDLRSIFDILQSCLESWLAFNKSYYCVCL